MEGGVKEKVAVGGRLKMGGITPGAVVPQPGEQWWQQLRRGGAPWVAMYTRLPGAWRVQAEQPERRPGHVCHRPTGTEGT